MQAVVNSRTLRVPTSANSLALASQLPSHLLRVVAVIAAQCSRIASPRLWRVGPSSRQVPEIGGRVSSIFPLDSLLLWTRPGPFAPVLYSINVSIIPGRATQHAIQFPFPRVPSKQPWTPAGPGFACDRPVLFPAFIRRRCPRALRPRRVWPTLPFALCAVDGP
jgi:hypothetical protein